MHLGPNMKDGVSEGFKLLNLLCTFTSRPLQTSIVDQPISYTAGLVLPVMRNTCRIITLTLGLTIAAVLLATRPSSIPLVSHPVPSAASNQPPTKAIINFNPRGSTPTQASAPLSPDQLKEEPVLLSCSLLRLRAQLFESTSRLNGCTSTDTTTLVTQSLVLVSELKTYAQIADDFSEEMKLRAPPARIRAKITGPDATHTNAISKAFFVRSEDLSSKIQECLSLAEKQRALITHSLKQKEWMLSYILSPEDSSAVHTLRQDCLRLDMHIDVLESIYRHVNNILLEPSNVALLFKLIRETE